MSEGNLHSVEQPGRLTTWKPMNIADKRLSMYKVVMPYSQVVRRHFGGKLRFALYFVSLSHMIWVLCLIDAPRCLTFYSVLIEVEADIIHG